MKLVSVFFQGRPRVGIVSDDGISCTVFTLSLANVPESLDELIRSECTGQSLIDMSAELPNTSHVLPLTDLEILSPIASPQKVICIGTNYADHAREMGGEPPEIPVVFNVFPSAIAGPGANVQLPSISDKVDFEAELVVVIGKSGKHIKRENAMDHVYGYCCGNDISARDWQKGKPGGQWLLGKTFDTFAPIGPWIATKDEIPDPQKLDIRLRLNGETMQDSNTCQLIFPVDNLIEHLSKFCTLNPGDLIFTGTPSGVGAGRTPPVFLKPGDQLEVEIDGLGVLANNVVADS